MDLPAGIAVFESIELIPWGLMLGSFLVGLLVRRYWVLLAILVLMIPFLGVALGVLEQGGDTPGTWPKAMREVFIYSTMGLLLGLEIGRLVLPPGRRSRPRSKIADQS